MAVRPDPIALELFKNAIFSIADEMALTVFRTTYSAVLKDNMDYSTAFADGDGRLAAQGLTLPGHLGSVPTAMEAIMRHYGQDMAPGDVFIMNDPFDGGMHLPDIFVMKPLYHEGERLAFACTVCHHTDVGGRVAGSNASDSTEIYAEGLRIAPMKLYEAGKLNKTIITFLEKNVRVPVMVLGDLRAQLAACHIAEKQFAELVARYGPAQTKQFLRETIDYSERLTRAALRDLPDGEWSFEDWIDDDGVDVGKPIRLFVTIRKTGDRMVVDWTGTNPQVRGAINNTLSYTKSASYTGIRSVLPNNIPNNEGVFRAIEVICPPGTVGNGVLPAACAARGLTGFRMVDCMYGALAMMLPDKVKAAGDGGNSGISIGGYDADRKPFVYVEFTCGAWGARPWADGLNGNSHMFANQSCPSAEVIEAEQPVSVLAYEFVSDARPDPIALELFKNAIFSIADEMALTVFRTTYSARAQGQHGLLDRLADGDGKLVAQGLTLPGHLGSVPTAMETMMRHFGADIAPGDVFIMNDPFDGGMHLPDIFVIKPIYQEGERLAFACTVCHHTDVGGRVAGSNASDSTEIFAEGLRIRP